jgi:glutamate synthase (NADPH/NADH) small chain
LSKFNIQAVTPEKRIKNFSEVICGLNKKQIIEQAKIFIDHKDAAADKEGCPLGTDVFAVLELIAQGNVTGAFAKIKEKNFLPAITGRFCEEPFDEIEACDKDGYLISIRMIERFLSDTVTIKAPKKVQPKKIENIAVIGSGASGLTAAGDLALLGHDVTVFEAMHECGGVMRYGIPEFRLSRKALNSDLDYLKSLGVVFKTSVLIGQTISYETLKEEFDIIYLSTGAGLSAEMKVPGEQAAGVLYGDDFLMKINLLQGHKYPKYTTNLLLGEKIVVIGSGNTAVDCARSCARLGCNVTMAIRKTEQDLHVKPIHTRFLQEEGVKLECLVNVVEILQNKGRQVYGVKSRRYDYADLNEDGQWTLEEVADSDFDIEADNVIIATGHKPNALYAKVFGALKLNKDGTIWTEKDSSKTSLKNVFVGGNVSDGAGSFMWAMLSAKEAVKEIKEYLKDRE